MSICTLPDAEALHYIGLLMDDACHRQSAADTDRAFALLEELQPLPLDVLEDDWKR